MPTFSAAPLCSPFVYSSPINSINSGSLPGNPTISTSKIISAFAGIRGFPAEAERPLAPNARLPYDFNELHKGDKHK